MSCSRTLLFTLFLLCSFILKAQLPLPQVVQSFKQKFPQAQNVEWQIHKENISANFNIEDTYNEAWFTSKGTWLKTNQIITENNLPERVKKCWKKKYPNVQSVNTLMKTSTKKKTRYSVSFETETHLVDLIMNKRGKIIKKNEALIDPEG